MNILDQYVKSLPSEQNALDIFVGEWSSAMPHEKAGLNAGSIRLFEDVRIKWAAEELGGFDGKRLLELGPLEAGHSYMLERMGAESILAIESNTRAYLKCLVAKEVLGLQRCRFLLGDFVSYLRETSQKYDVCLASGVLYHMTSPAELLALIAKVSDVAFFWTHYYDEDIIPKNRNLSHKFSKKQDHNYQGFQHSIYRQRYKAALGWAGFCGGAETYSYWMPSEDIIAGLRFFGFNSVEVGFHQPDHPNGPSFCLLCKK